MALSGTVNTTDYQGRYVQLTWTATQDKAKNQSTITWTVKGAGKATNTYYKAGPFYVNVGGTVKESTSRINLSEGTVISAVGGSKTITHNGKGEASFTISVKAAIYQAGYNCSGSKTFTLDTIPRAATISSAINFNDEGKPKMTFSNPAGSAATISVGIYWDSSTALIPYETVSSSATSKEWTLTTAQKNAIYSKMSTVKTKTVYYYIKTVIGSETFTNKIAKTLSITNATPTLNPTAVEDTNADTDGGDGAGNTTATGSNKRWIKGISDIRYTFNAAGVKGASIKTYSVKCGSKTGSSASGVLYDVDGASVVFTITDSRGNTATKTVSGTLINYVNLTCGLSATAALDTATTAKITLNISGNFFNNKLNTSTNNVLTLQYTYKEDDGDYGSWTTITPTKNGNKYSLTYEVPGTFDYQKNYTFRVRAQDDLQKAYSKYIYSAYITVTAKPVFDWSKEDFNFNCDVNINGELSINNEWHNLTIASGFKRYNDNAAAQPKYKVCGSVITVTGALTPTEAFVSNATETIIASGIPEAYCPQYAQYTICQGSGMNRWTLSVKANGDLSLQRYGTSAAITDTTVNAGAWLPFTLTYQF